MGEGQKVEDSPTPSFGKGQELETQSNFQAQGGGLKSWGKGVGKQCLAGRGGLSPGRKLRYGKREETAAAAAAGGSPMWQRGSRSRPGGGGPAKLRAGDTAAILFAYPTALLDALPAYRSTPPSPCKHPARRLLILLRHRLTAEAAARCPIWAREARDPGRRTPARAGPLVGSRMGRGDGMDSCWR